MPWQSIYQFKAGSGKRKEQSPVSASEAGSSGPLSEQYVPTTQAQASVIGSAIPAMESQVQAHVNFAPDARPSR